MKPAVPDFKVLADITPRYILYDLEKISLEFFSFSYNVAM